MDSADAASDFGSEFDDGVERAEFGALLEDSAEDLYENAPCGYLSTMPDGRIVKINATLLGWIGRERAEIVGRKRFADLLTVGGRLYHETHFAPLLRMQGQISGIALELRTATGERLPVLVTSVVRTATDGEPLLVRTTVFDAGDRRAYEQELLRARHEADAQRAEAEKARLLAEDERERYQRLATTLQQTLLPPVLTAPPGMRVAAHYDMASKDDVGGDFYDLFPLADGRWGLFLGDVRGKGAAAAVVTSLARYTLRSAAAFDADPAAVLVNLNRVLNQEFRGPDAQFCTVVFGILTPDGDGYRATLASGGHPPAVLLAAAGGAEYLTTPGGQLVGVLEEVRIATTTVRLGPGDTLLLYTDGLTEARVPAETFGPLVDGDRYGEPALLAFCGDQAPTSADALISALTELLDSFGDGLGDDAALLALSLPARSSAGEAAEPLREPSGKL